MKTHLFRVTVPDHLNDITTNTVTVDTECGIHLTEMLEAVKTFLTAIGYYFNEGDHIEIVNDDDWVTRTDKDTSNEVCPFEKVWKPHLSAQRLITHSADKCKGQNCPVHNPSDHHMKDWPQHYRADCGITERICPHGIGHPDPDDPNPDKVHGCDGCCEPPK